MSELTPFFIRSEKLFLGGPKVSDDESVKGCKAM